MIPPSVNALAEALELAWAAGEITPRRVAAHMHQTLLDLAELDMLNLPDPPTNPDAYR